MCLINHRLWVQIPPQTRRARVAQLDRATDYESEDRGSSPLVGFSSLNSAEEFLSYTQGVGGSNPSASNSYSSTGQSSGLLNHRWGFKSLYEFQGLCGATG